MKSSLASVVLLLLFAPFGGWLYGQEQDTLKVMTYNVLRFPEGNSLKAPLLSTIVRYLEPDIVGLNELTDSTALDSLNKHAFDTSVYAHANWVQESELMGMLYYNKQKLRLHKQISIATQPRRTNVYTLYSALQDFSIYPDTVFLTCALVHLKSSQGASNEALRAAQASDIRIYLDSRPPGGNFLLMGDFNLYTSSEAAWSNLLADGPNQLNDPINRPGNWSNNSAFSDIHTQSPRTASFDLGVTGGLDDRFDFILANDAVMDGRFGVLYLENTYQTPGNDGQHFNKSIIASPTNTSAPDSVIQALHDFSDHLPVVMNLELNYNNGFNANSSAYRQTCTFNEIRFKELAPGDVLYWTNLLQQTIPATFRDAQLLMPTSPGLYVLNFVSRTGEMCRLKVQVTQ